MDSRDKSLDFNKLNLHPKKDLPKGNKFRFDNYISPFWYGSLIDNSAKMENMKNIYESFRAGSISFEDFNEFLVDFNDLRPPARSL
jgi:hypothetical protein